MKIRESDRRKRQVEGMKINILGTEYTIIKQSEEENPKLEGKVWIYRAIFQEDCPGCQIGNTG